MNILLLSDIHGNYPALTAIEAFFVGEHFDHIVNCGDSLVYAPFPGETLNWLERYRAISILGNTDKKIIRLLQGKPLRKPAREDKRIMYTSTAAQLDAAARRHLLSLPISLSLRVFQPTTARDTYTIGIFHGSPDEPHEFLFADTPEERFQELAGHCDCQVVVTGHSHSPYHKIIAGIHFINPGSAGRMFDGDPRLSCAVLRLTAGVVEVEHFRIPYDIEEVVRALIDRRLPEIYVRMYREGRKLN
jgi:predicted phosphodiesterase